MEKRLKDPMLSFLIGYAGFFLIGLGALRFLKIQDSPGYILTFAGLWLMIIFLGNMEKKLIVKKKKAFLISKLILSAIFLALAGWFYF